MSLKSGADHRSARLRLTFGGANEPDTLNFHKNRGFPAAHSGLQTQDFFNSRLRLINANQESEGKKELSIGNYQLTSEVRSRS